MTRPGWRTFVFVWVSIAAGAADRSLLSAVIGGALAVWFVEMLGRLWADTVQWWADMKKIWRNRGGIDLDEFDEGTAEPRGLDLNGFDEGTVKRRDDD